MDSARLHDEILSCDTYLFQIYIWECFNDLLLTQPNKYNQFLSKQLGYV